MIELKPRRYGLLPKRLLSKACNWSVIACCCLSSFAAQAQISSAQVWAAACANCHGTNGQAQKGMPALAGRNQTDLVAKMMAYKNDQQPATIMHQIAKGYTDEQIEQIAAYFSAQTPMPR